MSRQRKLYRCTNCHWQVAGDPPTHCELCKTCDFEEHDARFGWPQLAVPFAVSVAYLLVTRWVGVVYDPLWMIAEGLRERAIAFVVLGAFLSVALICGAFSWWVFRNVYAYVLTGLCVALWVAFCIAMRMSVRA